MIKILKVHKMHHSEADIDKMHVKMKGERGVLQIEATYESVVINTARTYESRIHRRPIDKYCCKSRKQ